MDSYPGDLLAGVFPLVFAVDATIPSQDTEAVEKDSKTDEDARESALSRSSSSSTRSLFDRFMDALAASLVDDEEASPSRTRNTSDTLSTLLRSDDESSDEDDISFTEPVTRRNSRRSSPMTSFLHMKRGHSGTSPLKASSAYANYSSGEGFFQRARILSISTRHGFPPSKDPDGTKNRATLLSQARSTMALGAAGANAMKLKNILDQQPIDGILPVGWLEKHVHALPSALLVVTILSEDSQHEQQDQRLLETIEHLRESLAPKRECHIHIVCLLQDMAQISQGTIDTWFDNLRAHSSIQSSDISLLGSDDLIPRSTTTSSPALRRLHKAVRDASHAYYLQQARRAKRKHSILGHERQPTLLPLAIRYCFKIGVFYEFQLKHAKSLRFFAEAYRHVETYYRFLLGVATPVREVVVNPQADDMIEMSLAGTEASTGDDADEADPDDDQAGIEVALSDEAEEDEGDMEEAPPAGSESKKMFNIEAPDDMAHQCRAVADWLNFKLLQAGFLSSAFTESSEGIVAALDQWRRHTQSFFRKDAHNPLWNHWSYVSHQRLVMSQLVERHQPRSDMDLPEETIIGCKAWRNYLAATEATLSLGLEIRKEQQRNESGAGSSSEKTQTDSLRKRFVGGLISNGLAPKLEDECKRDHTEIALGMVLHAISLYEQEVEREKKEESQEETRDKKTSLGLAARLYYLAGGILLGRERHPDATPYLERATRYASGWPGLQRACSRMLIQCYDKHLPSSVSDENEESGTIVTKVLDSYFSTGMSFESPSRALANLVALGDKNVLKWKRVWTDGGDASLPFIFSVTFPGRTHAVSGETVSASVFLKSNFDHAVHLKSLTLLSMAGPIMVPFNDLQRAKNAHEGDDHGIVIQAQASILVTTQIGLPRELDQISLDESGSGGEKQGTTAKGAFSKSARPRTAGITSAAGARLVSEKIYGSGPTSQWSVSCLGGKSLRCDSIQLVFSPVHIEKGTTENFLVIDLTIEKKKPVPAVTIKRTPFEEDNFTASAWSRVFSLPLRYGPRCLRVLGPMPKMIVTNLTDKVVHGKALEGTVNRIVLKLKAGPDELCQDVRYRTSCSSSILSLDGTTRNLVEKEDASSAGSHEKIFSSRAPVIVLKTIASDQAFSADHGYVLPDGWSMVGTGQASPDIVAVEKLKADKEAYVALDFYRPPSKPIGSVLSGGSNKNEDAGGICQTDFSVTISYRQSRVQSAKAPPQGDEADTADQVSLEYTGSIVWASPIDADFLLARTSKAFPSGSRHPSNHCPPDDSENAHPLEDTSNSEIVLMDGEEVNAKCILQAKESLGVEIDEILFEDWDDVTAGEKACEFRHVGDERERGLLYKGSPDQISHRLTKQAKFGLTYSVQMKMLDGYKKGSISAHLGVVCVHWKPLVIPLPGGLLSVPSPSGVIDSHGPLVLEQPSIIKFVGPPCYIENPPFESSLQSNPALPRVASAFELSYLISNKTGMHQKLSVALSDLTSEGDAKESSASSEGILISGLLQGEIRLAPYESQTLSYTAIAMRAGRVTLPALSVSSDRHRTWVISGDSNARRNLFILP